MSQESIDALESAFVVHRSTPDRVHVELLGETWIEPIIRETAIAWYGESLRPILRREPLEQAENKSRQGVIDRLLIVGSPAYFAGPGAGIRNPPHANLRETPTSPGRETPRVEEPLARTRTPRPNEGANIDSLPRSTLPPLNSPQAPTGPVGIG